jgi:hypothetical protein
VSDECPGVVGVAKASILQILTRLTINKVAYRSEISLAILLAGKVGYPLNASYLVIPLLLASFNAGGNLNAGPGYWLCLRAIGLEERSIEPGALYIASLKVIYGNFNRETELRDVKVFSDSMKGVDSNLSESRMARTLVNKPQFTITSFE